MSKKTGALLTVSKDEYKKEVEEKWSKYDENKDGRLDKKEAKKFLVDIIKEVKGEIPSKDEIERQFCKMDADASGDIDKEEAIKFLRGYRVGHLLT